MSVFGYKLAGRHFLANISVDEKSAGGVIVPNRNPRKWRLPPDAYVGTVVEAGPNCEILKPGSVVTIQRWSWIQLDIDDEVMEAHEDHVLSVDGSPVNNVIAMELEREKSKVEQLILPEQVVSNQLKRYPTFRGKVIQSSVGKVPLGSRIWIKRANENQWRSDRGDIIFRWDDPNKDQMSNILCVDIR